jgi:hypothetical protein
MRSEATMTGEQVSGKMEANVVHLNIVLSSGIQLKTLWKTKTFSEKPVIRPEFQSGCSLIQR